MFKIDNVVSETRIIQMVLLCLLAFMVIGCKSSKAPAAKTKNDSLVPVELVRVEQSAWVDELAAMGTVQANDSVLLAAKVTETVKRINFADGSHVEAGAVLVELTDRSEIAALAEGQAVEVDASKQYERLLELSKQNKVSQAALDAQRASRDAARARVQAIKARLGDRIITAPFAGQIGFRQVSVGALVTPGTVITTLDDLHVVKLDFVLPERYLTALRVGQSVEAKSVAYADQVFSGTITAIDSRVDELSRTIKARVVLDNAEGRLRSGMMLSVTLKAEPRMLLQIPEIAAMAIQDRQYVFQVKEDGVAKRVEVELGSRQGGRVEVVAGLLVGDVIVGQGLVKMRDGVRVKPINAASGAVAP
jgi:membrane fusion protein (multidrug efflux system)